MWGWQCRAVGLCSLAGRASPGAPAPLTTVVSFLRKLLPSGPHVLPVGMSGALEDSAPAQSNCYQRWEPRGKGGALPRAAGGAFGDLKRGSVRQRPRGNQRQKVTERDTGRH